MQNLIACFRYHDLTTAHLSNGWHIYSWLKSYQLVSSHFLHITRKQSIFRLANQVSIPTEHKLVCIAH